MLKVWLWLPLLGCVLLDSGWADGELGTLLAQQQMDLGLSTAEMDALRPFYSELQTQRDYLEAQNMRNDNNSTQFEISTLDGSYAKLFDELTAQLHGYLSFKPSIEYNTTLPTLERVLGQSTRDMTEHELEELQDLMDILQDVIDASQLGIIQLVQRAKEMEVNLLKLNKPKIVIAAIAGLEVMWQTWGRARQAAYCSYMHVPQFREAISAINNGVDCYTYTMDLILQVQNETLGSVKEIKENVKRLVKIYKKISDKKTLMGKILSGTLNVFSALRRVHDIIAVGIAGYDKINNQLPGATMLSAQCGSKFVSSIPQMIETAQNLTLCITFVDTDKPDYDFLQPEDDRYWNTGAAPPEIPHENDVAEDDEYVENIEDDYVDHR